MPGRDVAKPFRGSAAIEQSRYLLQRATVQRTSAQTTGNEINYDTELTLIMAKLKYMLFSSFP